MHASKGWPVIFECSHSKTPLIAVPALCIGGERGKERERGGGSEVAAERARVIDLSFSRAGLRIKRTVNGRERGEVLRKV